MTSVTSLWGRVPPLGRCQNMTLPFRGAATLGTLGLSFCTLNAWHRARAVSVRMGLYAVNHARGGASLTNSKHTERSQNSAFWGRYSGRKGSSRVGGPSLGSPSKNAIDQKYNKTQIKTIIQSN